MKEKYVLACDDDAGIVEIIKIVLEERGLKIRVTTNSEKVYEIIEEQPPGLILLDLWMPRLRGEKIIKTLKADPKTKKIPIIVISASKDAQAVTKESGADDFLGKPFDLEDLEAIVDKYI